MSDSILNRGKKLVDDVVKDIKSKRGTLSKLREMTKLSKEIDPDFDTTDIEELLDVSETVADDILKRLDKSQPKT